MANKISKTAFLVNESRRRRLDISKDHYSHLWVDEETQKLWQHFSDHVTPNDDLVISYRHSYFLERLREFLSQHTEASYVGLGAGFTSYPFLFENEVTALEVDRIEIIEHKAKAVEKFQREGSLPLRPVKFVAANLMNESERKVAVEEMAKIIERRPSFVLIEGITYYLSQECLDHIFTELEGLLPSGARVGLDYWAPEFEQTSLFKAVVDYVEKEWGFSKSEFLFLDDSYFDSISGFMVQNRSSGPAEERRKGLSNELQECDQTMTEHYVILQKQ